MKGGIRTPDLSGLTSELNRLSMGALQYAYPVEKLPGAAQGKPNQ